MKGPFLNIALDLVFVCAKSSKSQSIQIHVNSRQDGFKLAQELDLPSGTGPLSFADIDGDGSIDIVFPVCEGSKCSIHIVYNQQMGLCTKNKEGTGCRKANALCIADSNFKFDFTKPNTEVHSSIVVFIK